MTTPLHPELAAPQQPRMGPPPDAATVSYRAAGEVLNGGTHAARDGYDPRPVDEDQLATRVEALHGTTDALLIATAVLRDAITGEAPDVADHINRAVSALNEASTALHGVRRHLDGPVTPDVGDDE
ncbi:hypothetical protein AB0C98_43445 [Streptomyces sp. NPDC048558]|uniref:hypothetical protein n=1 Tax=Actinomycetes TaxID=1760 RepID=UPI0034363E52